MSNGVLQGVATGKYTFANPRPTRKKCTPPPAPPLTLSPHRTRNHWGGGGGQASKMEIHKCFYGSLFIHSWPPWPPLWVINSGDPLLWGGGGCQHEVILADYDRFDYISTYHWAQQEKWTPPSFSSPCPSINWNGSSTKIKANGHQSKNEGKRKRKLRGETGHTSRRQCIRQKNKAPATAQ